MNNEIFFKNLENFINKLDSFYEIISWKRILILVIILTPIIILFKYISWPRLALILSIIIIVAYYQNIATFIDRVLKIGKDGIMLSPLSQSVVPTITFMENANFQQSIDNSSSMQTIRGYEKDINDYVSRNFDNNVEDKSKKLISALAIAQFEIRCTRVYFAIFGSQIELLKHLSRNSVSGLDQSSIDQYFEKIKKDHADFYEKGNWGVSQYLSFLIQSGLVSVGKNNNYQITVFGKDFLSWLQCTGTPENKNF